MNTRKTTATVLIAIATMFTLSACNTTAGVGKDIKSTGKAIERGANEARPSNN